MRYSVPIRSRTLEEEEPMADGAEERKEREMRLEQEKREKRENGVYRHEEDGAPERPGS